MGLADLDELDISILQRIHGTENEAWEGDFSRRCVICMNDIARRSIFAAIRTNPLFCCVLHPLLLIRSEVLRILAMGILQSGFLWLPPMLDSQLAMIGSRGSCSLLILNKMHHIRLDDYVSAPSRRFPLSPVWACRRPPSAKTNVCDWMIGNYF